MHSFNHQYTGEDLEGSAYYVAERRAGGIMR